MALKGDLLSADLSNVFQMLAMNRQRGRLEVRDRREILNVRRIYIDENQVALLDPPPDRPLEGLLIQSGMVTYQELHQARNQGKRYGHRTLQVLLSQGCLTIEEAERAKNLVEQEGILEVFLWKNVTFSLEESAERPEGVTFFNIDHVVMEAARRQDEWGHVVRDGAGRWGIFKPLVEGQLIGREDLDDVQKFVFEFVDGVVGAAEIAQASGLPRGAVEMALVGLEEKGCVAQLDLEELTARADELMAKGDEVAAIRLLRAALRCDRTNVLVHKKLAAACLLAGNLAKAAAHYRFCAVTLMKRGHRREAISILEHVIKLLPTDLVTLQECIQLLAEEGRIASKEDETVARQGGRLVRFFLETGRDAEALQTAEALHRLDPSDEERLLLLARLRLKEGQAQEAVQAYLEVAQARAARGEVEGATEIYKTLGEVDPSSRRIYQGRIAAMEREREDSRKKSRKGRAGIRVGVLVFSLALGYWIYHSLAGTALEDMREMEAPTHPEGARALADTYNDFADRHPFTLAAAAARELERKWRDEARKLAEEAVARRQHMEAMRKQAARQASRKLEEALGWMKAGNLDRSLKAFEEALELGSRAGALWEEREKAAKGRADVKRYLEEGRKDLDRGRELLAEGRRREAFAVLKSVATKHDLLPEVKRLEFPLEISVHPSVAEIRVLGEQAVRGKGRLELFWPLARELRLSAGAPGYETRVCEITMPPGDYVTTVVLAREPARTIPLPDHVVGLSALRPGLAVLCARNGVVLGFDASRGRISFRVTRGNILTTRLPPVPMTRGRFASLSEDGVATLFTSEGRGVSAFRVLDGDGTLLSPVPLGDDLVIGTREGVCKRVDLENGREVWSRKVQGGLAGMHAAAGHVVLETREQTIIVLDGASGATLRRLANEGGGGLVLRPDGRLIVHAPGQGWLGLKLPGGRPELIAVFEGRLEGKPLFRDDRLLHAVAGVGLVVMDAEGTSKVTPLPAPVRRILDVSKDHALLLLEDGTLPVVDLKRSEVLFSLGSATDASVDPVFCGPRILSVQRDRRLAVTEIE